MSPSGKKQSAPILVKTFAEKRFLSLVLSAVGNGCQALWLIEDFAYSSKELTLYPHDSLVMYPDGVTETMDVQNRLYGEKRFEAVLSHLASESAKGIVKAVLADVKDVTVQAPQSDDITLLSLKYLANHLQGLVEG